MPAKSIREGERKKRPSARRKRDRCAGALIVHREKYKRRKRRGSERNKVNARRKG
jgi:hypothetical protein